MKRKLIAAVGVAGMVIGLAACGDSEDGKAKADAGPKEITVWVMDGSAPKAWIDEVNKEFSAKHPGVTVKVEEQKWTGIQEKVTTALSENSPPDVLELGNTQTAGYAVTGGLADLTKDKAKLGADAWQKSMLASAEVDGKLYSAPWYAANRVVIYDKKAFEKAGVTPPKTRDEWVAGLEKLKAADPASQPIYLPGQSWYILAGLIWDEGGELATKDGDKWKGGLATPQAASAMEFYKKLQSFSTAPKDKDEATPQQSVDIVPKGGVSSWIGLGWEAGGAEKALKEAGKEADFGYFPIPGKTADKSGTVFLGGSNLAVAERSKNKELAKEWLALAAGKDQMTKYAVETKGALLPNQAGANFAAPAGSFAEAMAKAGLNGKITPVTAGWANVETEPNPIKEFMTKVLNGEDPAKAGAAADAEIAKRINK
ncbi:extracellular solute-binding protein [Streptomyces xanthophaeus]|uniref:Sugar transporter n=1 Tax=Streptomyces xanthophaeus TaxID=67385 RepID=A0A919H4U7_9ACTN|nr:extracellular solute-binding protein [Streptomyces xanthophaeus]WCD88596.1 Maltodextrin-binding protein MdxE [Streptomyces xanthophaeus]WST24592.1 extracellular solute-binding protein [Streptomyces xanthophaeus]WST60434.1 extracellular solute-binding protein [Streptomyces xanthophaeus]GHI87474.1 sugar transporter [Streptomyces xanthophaeus]